MLTSTKIVKITKFSFASAVRLSQSLNAAANTIYFLPLENKCQDFNLWGWPKRDGLSEPFCVHSCLFDQSWSMECWWLNQLIGDHTWLVFVMSSPLSVISPVIIIVMLWVNIGDIRIHEALVVLHTKSQQKKVYRQENVFDEINPREYVIFDHDPTCHDKCVGPQSSDHIAQCHNLSPRVCELWWQLAGKVILSWRSGQESGTSLRMSLRGLNVTGKLSSDKELRVGNILREFRGVKITNTGL